MGNSGHSIIKRSSPPTTAYCRMEQEQQRITEQPEGTDLWIPPDPGRARTGSDMSFHQLLKEEIRTLFQKLKCGLCNSPPVPFNLYNVRPDDLFPQASTQSCTPGLSQAISLCHPWGTWWLVMACLVSHSHREPLVVPRATPDWWSYWSPQHASYTPSLFRSVHSALWAFASEFSNWFSFTSSSSWYYSFCIFLSAYSSLFLSQGFRAQALDSECLGSSCSFDPKPATYMVCLDVSLCFCKWSDSDTTHQGHLWALSPQLPE